VVFTRAVFTVPVFGIESSAADSATEVTALHAAEHAAKWTHGLLLSDSDDNVSSSIAKLTELIYGYRDELAATIKYASDKDAQRRQHAAGHFDAHRRCRDRVAGGVSVRRGSMTFVALEADVVRQRKPYQEDPHEYRTEMLLGIRNRCALIERFFQLGSSVTMNRNETVLPDSMDDQVPIVMALQDLAHDIVVAAKWLDEERYQSSPTAVGRKGGAR